MHKDNLQFGALPIGLSRIRRVCGPLSACEREREGERETQTDVPEAFLVGQFSFRDTVVSTSRGTLMQTQTYYSRYYWDL